MGRMKNILCVIYYVYIDEIYEEGIGMEVYIMPSLGSIIYQILFLIVIASLIYSCFLFVKALVYCKWKVNLIEI